MSDFNCRMYEKKYPEENELVMVTVTSVGEMGVYVSLLEYNNIEGMILLSEISRRRIRSLTKLVRVGRQEVVVVVRVDKEKGYIDLSKRRVTPEEITKCEERYNKSKAVHSIIRHLATRLTMDEKVIKPKQLYKQFGWALYTKYQHAYDAFRLSISEPAVFEGFDISPDQLKVLMEIISHKLKPQPMKIRADLEMTCFDYEGIDAIKAAVLASQNHAIQFAQKNAEGQIDDKSFGVVTVTLIAPPLYVMVGTFDDKEKGLAMLSKCVEILGEELEKRKGRLTVKIPARAVGASDDQELDDLMEQLERENELVDGDNSDEDEDEN
ncbi:eukaryotic translation initiation factor 2 subunit 1 [Heterostelium album PN500]|uniref:Eukaryotic translation initiation factor 2 subunit 1 n=1 Tax=Heterostelium pallidum (strain ATCC 26659 / Pp 5 / PN500) TaxID=670386 RepID=D3AZF5_HETP5|nr:eukaryotic translation initiation factor 2 subunit 1 [Heterostelium album PN500]EFA85538.1 eukaryotic translation initiation factor 2 subunit 1 [Heterostelium album PN500]|eukprot:XP_020437646.1 eukaryotic translation initiation factor 2 subunit 1 [Heterostelium album PN500]